MEDPLSYGIAMLLGQEPSPIFGIVTIVRLPRELSPPDQFPKSQNASKGARPAGGPLKGTPRSLWEVPCSDARPLLVRVR